MTPSRTPWTSEWVFRSANDPRVVWMEAFYEMKRCPSCGERSYCECASDAAVSLRRGCGRAELISGHWFRDDRRTVLFV